MKKERKKRFEIGKGRNMVYGEMREKRVSEIRNEKED
jgi:hypothetical protein